MMPLTLTPPVSPSEGVAIAEAVMRLSKGGKWDASLRGKLQGLLPTLGLEKVQVFAQTLVVDPRHASTFYLLVESGAKPWLLHIAPATAATTALFPNPVMLARVRPMGEREMVLNAIDAGAYLETMMRELYPEMVARPTAVHSIWSSSGAPAEFLRGFGKRPGWMAGLRVSEGGWGVYLDVLKTGWRDGLVLVREGLRTVPEDAAGCSRFSFVVDDLKDVRRVAEWRKGLSEVVRRSHDVELDLSGHAGLEPSALEVLLDHLKLLGVEVQSVELSTNLPAFAMVLQARQIGMTLREEEPLTTFSGVRMHWKRGA